MKDHWIQLAKKVRENRKSSENSALCDVEEMPFGFAESVSRRLSLARRSEPTEAWIALLRPALGLSCATALLCVLLQIRTNNQPADNLPENLLVQTENLIRMAVLE
jgi:hypothetical protein